MAKSFAMLADPATVSDSAAAILTCGANQKLQITGIWLFNGNSSAETVKLYFVKNNAGSVGTAAAGNQIWQGDGAGHDLAAYASKWIEAGQVPEMILEEQNDTIQAVTDTASKVVRFIVGWVETTS